MSPAHLLKEPVYKSKEFTFEVNSLKKWVVPHLDIVYASGEFSDYKVYMELQQVLTPVSNKVNTPGN